jgi:hypothetical protein
MPISPPSVRRESPEVNKNKTTGKRCVVLRVTVSVAKLSFSSVSFFYSYSIQI